MRIQTNAFALALLAAGSGIVTAAAAAPTASAPARTPVAPAAVGSSSTPAGAPIPLAQQPALRPSHEANLVAAFHPSIRLASSVVFVQPTGGLKLPELPKDFVVVKDFSGESPLSGLTLHKGLMYGTTAVNFSGPGSVYRYTPGKTVFDMGTVDILHKFPQGGFAYTDLVVASSTDAVFGSTQHGGAYGAGYLFRIASNGTYKVVHDYHQANGSTYDSVPGALLFDPQDDMFAVTQVAVTKKTPGDDIASRASLPKTTSAGVSLARSPDGTLFVSTFWGDCAGKNGMGYGALIELRPQHTATKCLYGADHFNRGSFGSLIALDDDTVIGTLGGDASSGKGGAVFKWKRGEGIKLLHVFDPDTEGSSGSIMRAPNGAYYGTTVKITQAGGQAVAGGGILFKMSPGGAITPLHKFTCGADGCIPGGLVVHDGYVYGVTAHGGAYGHGGIFRYKLP